MNKIYGQSAHKLLKMKIIALHIKQNTANDTKLRGMVVQFERLIGELNSKDLPAATVGFINKEIEQVNRTEKSGNELRRLLVKNRAAIIKWLEKKHKIVPKYYYRNQWLVLGMLLFGVPIGLALGAPNGHTALLAFGMPIGIAIGLTIGGQKDKKALMEGRQLNITLKDTFCL